MGPKRAPGGPKNMFYKFWEGLGASWDLVSKIKDLAKLKGLCGKGNAWTPRAGDHGRKGLTNEITRG